MDKSQKNRIFFLSLTFIWLIMAGLAIYSGNILSILITIIFSGRLIWIQMDRYKEKNKYELDYFPDSFPVCKKTDTELFTEFLNENHSRKNLLKGDFRYSFIISKEGRIVAPKIIKKPKGIDSKEIISVILKLQDWTPSTKKGENVNYKFTGGFGLTIVTIDRNRKIGLIPFNDSAKLKKVIEKEKTSTQHFV